MISRLRSALLAQLERTADEPTEDGVHDLRVCTRRLSEAVYDIPHSGELRKRLRRIRKCAAAVRDRDITLRLLRRFHLPANDPARHYLQGQRDLAAEQLRKFLRRQLRRLPDLDAEQGTPRNLVPLCKAFFQAGGKARDVEGMHALRIAAKRLRYALELSERKGAEPRLTLLRRVQSQLGDMHDALVASDFLKASPKPSAAARKAAGELRAAAGAQAEAFATHWKRRFGERTEQAWLTWAGSDEL